MASLQEYVYQDLKGPTTIRLLYLLPCASSSPDQRLKCNLEAVSLAEMPSYLALSYTWGPDVFPQTLMCDDKVLKITQNLYEALIHFRLKEQALVIWVDAICINQINLQEKSLQLLLMEQIYGQAAEVLIWLGKASEGSDEVMKYLKRIGQLFLNRGGDILEPRDERSPENDALWKQVTGDPNLERAHLIWQRPWFSRRWIIQEMALAERPVLHCGTESMEWDVAFHACKALGRLRGDGSHFWNKATNRPINTQSLYSLNFWKLDDIRKEIWAVDGQKQQRQIHKCMDDARGFDCRDDKDRVFALQGIHNRGRPHPLQIEYRKSEAEVYEAFARHCLQHDTTVDILSFAGETNHASIEGRLGLPSWVPDWRLRFKSPVDMLHCFRAGHRLASNVELHDDSKELLARGKLVDRVLAVVPPIESFKKPDQAKTFSYIKPGHIADWYMHVELVFSKAFGVNYGTKEGYIGGGDIWDALARTLIIDRKDEAIIFDHKRDRPEQHSLGVTPPLHEEFHNFRAHMLSSLMASEDDAAKEEAAEAPLYVLTYEQTEYHTRAVLLSEDRCFYITKKGYVGLGPVGLVPGDVICVLAGSSVPYVMRPLRADFCMVGEGVVSIRREAYMQMPNGDRKLLIQREQEHKYRLIGECYTHGVMLGEVWDLEHAFFEDFRIV